MDAETDTRSPASDSQPPLEPFPPGTDYFSAMGLSRLMNLDEAAMEGTFYDLSRRFHPDRYATAAPRARITSLENSALVNKAYRTLRDPWERARYLVELEAGKSSDIAAQTPQDLFEDILDLQETLMELRMGFVEDEDVDGLKEMVARAALPFREAFSALDARRQSLFNAWDAAAKANDEAAKRDVLTRLKGLLGERRYLMRVTADIDAALEGKPAPREI